MRIIDWSSDVCSSELANLLHHCGSAAGLQKALIERMTGAITSTIREAALRARAVDQNPREVVDLTFDAFDTGGAGALASWMILSGDEDALDPIQIGRAHV